MAYEVRGVEGDESLDQTIASWRDIDDADPMKIWTALLMLDRAGDDAYLPMYNDLAKYTQEHRWAETAGDEAMDRLLSRELPEAQRESYTLILLLAPDQWLSDYIRRANAHLLSMSNPERLVLLFDSVAAELHVNDDRIPPWLVEKMKRLATLGGRAAYPYVAYGPDSPYLVNRLIDFANSEDVEDIQLLLVYRLRRSLLKKHYDQLSREIEREQARKILLACGGDH